MENSESTFTFSADAPPRPTLDGKGIFNSQVAVIPHVRRLLQIQRDLDVWREKIEESELITLTEEVSDDMRLLNLALDMIGVPAQQLPNEDRGEKFNSSRHFRRDLFNVLYEVAVFERNDIETFLAVATGGRVISDKWENEDDLSLLLYGDNSETDHDAGDSDDPEAVWDGTAETLTLTQGQHAEVLELRSVSTERDVLSIVVRLNGLPWMTPGAVNLAVQKIADLLGFQV